MKVSIKSLGLPMEIKNTGVEFEVYDNNNVFRGDCFVTKANLIWCKGKTKRDNGKKISWKKFIAWAEEEN